MKDRRQKGAVVHMKRADRKSTRLNSSHLVISYAVFCLKKKKNTKNINNLENSSHDHHLPHATSSAAHTSQPEHIGDNKEANTHHVNLRHDASRCVRESA